MAVKKQLKPTPKLLATAIAKAFLVQQRKQVLVPSKPKVAVNQAARSKKLTPAGVVTAPKLTTRKTPPARMRANARMTTDDQSLNTPQLTRQMGVVVQQKSPRQRPVSSIQTSLTNKPLSKGRSRHNPPVATVVDDPGKKALFYEVLAATKQQFSDLKLVKGIAFHAPATDANPDYYYETPLQAQPLVTTKKCLQIVRDKFYEICVLETNYDQYLALTLDQHAKTLGFLFQYLERSKELVVYNVIGFKLREVVAFLHRINIKVSAEHVKEMA